MGFTPTEVELHTELAEARTTLENREAYIRHLHRAFLHLAKEDDSELASVSEHVQADVDTIILTRGSLREELKEALVQLEGVRLEHQQYAVRLVERGAELVEARAEAEKASGALHVALMNAESMAQAAKAATAGMERIKKALGFDRPYNIMSVLEVLADAADHLLHTHNCDAHGHERTKAAAESARKMLRDLIKKGAIDG